MPQNLGILEEFIADNRVTEIMVNGHSSVFLEKNGKIELSQKSFNNEQEVYQIIDNILKPLGKSVDANTPFADARLADGSRVNVIIPPVSLSGPMITIRKFFKEKLSGQNLVEFNTLSPNMLKFLELCVKAKRNIIVSGGTGSGKTTLLNVLSSFIEKSERIVTIEDAAELSLNQENIGRLETKSKDINGKGEVSIRQLLINSLRMRPDRIIVGECRSGEALDMLQAMNTGHNGSLTTIHSNTPRDCLKRLETMVLMAGFELPVAAIRDQIATAVNIIVQISRLSDGSRKITEISQITGMEGSIITMSPVFKFVQSHIDPSNGKIKGEFESTGIVPSFIEELKGKNLPVDLKIF